MPPEFYSSLANTLGSGGVYKLWFPNYSVYTGHPVLATNKNSVTSFSVSTKSLDYVIGTFRLPNYDVEGPVLNTRLAPINSLEYGSTFSTADNQIDSSAASQFERKVLG